MDGAEGRAAQPGVDGHIVVFGFQGVGRRIVRQLTTTGRRVLVVDPYADAAQQVDLTRWGATYLAGYGDSQDTLVAADVAGALAVLCVTDDDVRNIRLALLVRDVSADVRIVVRMANASVGSALRARGPARRRARRRPARVGLVRRGGGQPHDPRHHDRRRAVRHGDEGLPGQREHRVDLGGPRARGGAPRADSPAVSVHSADRPVEAGDLVTLIGTADDYRRAGLELDSGHAQALGPNLRRRVREGSRRCPTPSTVRSASRSASCSACPPLSIAVLMLTYREPDGTPMSLLDAVYFTAETIATVGFGDFYFRDQPALLRLWAVCSSSWARRSSPSPRHFSPMRSSRVAWSSPSVASASPD